MGSSDISNVLHCHAFHIFLFNQVMSRSDLNTFTTSHKAGDEMQVMGEIVMG